MGYNEEIKRICRNYTDYKKLLDAIDNIIFSHRENADKVITIKEILKEYKKIN